MATWPCGSHSVSKMVAASNGMGRCTSKRSVMRILQGPQLDDVPVRGGVSPASVSSQSARSASGPAPTTMSTQPATTGANRAHASAWRSSTPSGPQSA